MTTTGVYQGIGDNPKNSSRVLRPPGGGSSDIFGSGSAGHADALEQNQNNKKLNTTSHIFDSPTASEDQAGYKHINRKPQPSSQSAIFGEEKSPAASAAELKKRNNEEEWYSQKQQQTKSKSEEFPAYDRSVYMSQMTPQRRNIQQVSSYNPITNESYDGFGEEQPHQQTAKRRGQNVNLVSDYNVITNQNYANGGHGGDPSPAKPGKRVMTMSNSSDEGTYNPITGQEIGSKADQQKSSSRVLNPPGGKSSGLW